VRLKRWEKYTLWGMIIGCIYFVCVFVVSVAYMRKHADVPLILSALSHDEYFSWITRGVFMGEDFWHLSQSVQERIVFVHGIIFYVILGAVLGFTLSSRKQNKDLWGLFLGISSGMLGYPLGVLIDGEPPIFAFMNPPIFAIVGYVVGLYTFPLLIKNEKDLRSGLQTCI
jgi:hypothetical protein